MKEFIILHKSRIFSIVLLCVFVGFYIYKKTTTNVTIHIQGNTMGTYYNVKYCGNENLKEQIDSVLYVFNQSLSTYEESSEISVFNKTGNLKIKSPFFYPVIKKSKEVFEKTNGAFDPTIMVLVNAWGFGFRNKEIIDSILIDSLIKLVDFNEIYFTEDSVKTFKKDQMLDFSAIAKGYGVDIVSNYLKSKNINDFMVEIGGEVYCSGTNCDKNSWKIGIDNPNSELPNEKKLSEIIELQNFALATSGNYRNFYIDEYGEKQAHTINPKTGYPEKNNVLSVSVKAKTCMEADAYATAFMVLGLEKSKVIIESEQNIEALIIYNENNMTKIWKSTNF